MSMKQDHHPSSGGDKDPFAQLSQGIERSVRKKKSLNDDDLHQDHPATAQQPRDLASPAQSNASAAAAAVLMSHWSDQKAPTAAPIDTLTTADRQRMVNKHRVAHDPAKNAKSDPAANAAEPSKSQSHE